MQCDNRAPSSQWLGCPQNVIRNTKTGFAVRAGGVARKRLKRCHGAQGHGAKREAGALSLAPLLPFPTRRALAQLHRALATAVCAPEAVRSTSSSLSSSTSSITLICIRLHSIRSHFITRRRTSNFDNPQAPGFRKPSAARLGGTRI